MNRKTTRQSLALMFHGALAITLFTASCGDPEPTQSPADSCGAGVAISDGDETFCVYSQNIIETGFSCPPSAKQRLPYGALVVCSPSGTIPTPVRQEIHTRYNNVELPPQQAPLCTAPPDCASGLSCEGGACQVASTASCDSDDACAADQACVEGECVEAPPTQPECTSHADCGSRERCQDQVCVDWVNPINSCANDAECGADEVCSDGACLAQSPQLACSADADCATGEVCLDGACLPEGSCSVDAHCEVNELCNPITASCAPASSPMLCETSGDCLEGHTCVNGACEPPASIPCAADADCSVDEVCLAGACGEAPAPCTADADCTAGQVCVVDTGLCIAE